MSVRNINSYRTELEFYMDTFNFNIEPIDSLDQNSNSQDYKISITTTSDSNNSTDKSTTTLVERMKLV